MMIKMLKTIILLGIIAASLVLPLYALAQGDGISVSKFELYYYEGPKVETPYLLAGKAYKATVEITMGEKTPPNVKVIVATDLAQYKGGQLFTVDEAVNVKWNYTSDKTGIVIIANPGGRIKLTLVGEIPEIVTTRTVDGLTLHFPVKMSVIKVFYENNPGNPIDAKTYEVIDEVIEEYRKLLNEKKTLLQTEGADETWLNMVKSIIDEAERLANTGLVEQARDLLNTIPNKPVLKPPEGEKSLYYMIMGGLGIIVIVGIVMWLRATGKAKMLEEKLHSITADLEALSVRVEKLDKRLGSELRDIIEKAKASI